MREISFPYGLHRYGSIAIVGMAKNTGKTECLNFVLARMHEEGFNPAVTSIGVDGESVDVVTHTGKPEITLREGTLFVTSESFYKTRRLTSEVYETGQRQTALGKLVTAKVVTPGKVILAGPSDAASVRRLIQKFNAQGIRPVIVDGALSRVSTAAPTVTEALILATGAALSPRPEEIVRRTAFLCRLIDLPQVAEPTAKSLEGIEAGVWGLSDEGAVDLGIKTALSLTGHKGEIVSFLRDKGKTLYIGGAVTDGVLTFFNSIPESKEMTLVIRDFTCMFAGPLPYATFMKRGAQIKVLHKPRLLGICVNPVSPEGYHVDSSSLCRQIEETTGYPAVDLRREK